MCGPRPWSVWCRNLLSETGPDARSAEIPPRQDSPKRVPEPPVEISLLLPPFLAWSRVGWADPKIAVALAVPGCNATVSSRERVRRALFLLSHALRVQPFSPVSPNVSPTCTRHHLSLFSSACIYSHALHIRAHRHMDICLASARS